MTFKKFQDQTGMKTSQLSREFGIPYRTVQNWHLGINDCPEYLLPLMQLKLDFGRHQEDLQFLYSYLETHEDKDIALMHNAGMDKTPSSILFDFLA